MSRFEIVRRLRRSGLTSFQIRVLLTVIDIPAGETRSYREVAEAAGRPRAYRAVGTALKLNPMPIAIPCHRVIRSDGTPGRYSAGGTRKKIALLRAERAKKRLRMSKR